eukprot:gene1275-1606_t
MSRHSKHSASGAKFSNYERSLLSYGTKVERLGRDSLKNYDSCSICLNPLISPLSCLKGHLFCKECIYTSLLKQKKEIKIKEKEWELQQSKQKEQDQLKLDLEKENQLLKFEKDNVSILSNIVDKDKNSNTTTTTSTSTTTTDENTVVDKELKLKSFWVPSLTPQSKNNLIEKPCPNTMCHEGNHPLKVKQLIQVKFSILSSNNNDSSSRKKINDDQDLPIVNGKEQLQYYCKICTKQFNNSSNLVLLKKCGHEKEKLKNNNNIINNETKNNESSGTCYICEKPFDYDTDLIQLYKGGTGFAGRHGSELQAKKYTPTAII